MKNTSLLRKTSRSILVASMMFGIAGIVPAQSTSGTGSASRGAGQAGGSNQTPSTPGRALTGPGSDSPQGGSGSTSGRTLTGPGSDSPQGGPGSTTGRVLTGPGSDSPQGGPASRQGMTGKKESSTGSSKKQRSGSTGY
jgi:hypothetical protein